MTLFGEMTWIWYTKLCIFLKDCFRCNGKDKIIAQNEIQKEHKSLRSGMASPWLEQNYYFHQGSNSPSQQETGTPESLANCVVINVTSTHIHNHSPIIFHCKHLKPHFMGLHGLLIKMTDAKWYLTKWWLPCSWLIRKADHQDNWRFCQFPQYPSLQCSGTVTHQTLRRERLPKVTQTTKPCSCWWMVQIITMKITSIRFINWN